MGELRCKSGIDGISNASGIGMGELLCKNGIGTDGREAFQTGFFPRSIFSEMTLLGTLIPFAEYSGVTDSIWWCT